MTMGCGAKCAKIILIVFNLVFWLSGAALLGVGIWMRVDTSIERYLDVISEVNDQNFIHTVAYILIGAGAFVFVVGFLGCCGALRESKCMLGLYIVFLFLVLGIELAAGIMAIIFRNTLKDELQDKWGEIINEKYTDDRESPFVLGMDFLQVKFECCGVKEEETSQVYVGGEFENANEVTQFKVPASCCKMNEQPDDIEKYITEQLDTDTIDPDLYSDLTACRETTAVADIHTKGCYDSLTDFVEEKAIILIGIGIAIACLEVFGIIFAICLCRSVDPE